MLFRLLGRELKFLRVPVGITDVNIEFFEFLVKIFPAPEYAAEFGKIGRHYATENMPILDPETEKYSAEN